MVLYDRLGSLGIMIFVVLAWLLSEVAANPNLLRRCPAPTALNRRDDLKSIRSIGHRHDLYANFTKYIFTTSQDTRNSNRDKFGQDWHLDFTQKHCLEAVDSSPSTC
jgi:hypothetical protein